MNGHLITAKDFGKDWLHETVENSVRTWERIRKRSELPQLGMRVCNLFLEKSLRTRMSYETAERLTGCTFETTFGSEGTSLGKNESLSSTVRMIAGNGYDVLVMRTEVEGAHRWLAEMLARRGYPMRIHCAGDGGKGHPSQTVLDLATILHLHGKLSGFSIALGGDPGHSRTHLSLIRALALLDDVSVLEVSSPESALPTWLTRGLQDFKQTDNFDLLLNYRFWMWSRVQKARYGKDIAAYDRACAQQSIGRAELDRYGENAIVLHPLPIGNNEIHPDILGDPRVMVDLQASFGPPSRAVLLEWTKSCLDTDVKPTEEEDPVIESDRGGTVKDLARSKQRDGKHFVELDDGTIIDRLPVGMARHLQRVLVPEELIGKHGPVIPYEGVPTKKMPGGLKDVLRLEGRWLTPREIAMVAALVPRTPFTVFHEGSYEKQHVTSVPSVSGIGTGLNSMCITNRDVEAALHPRFQINDFGGENSETACFYCGNHARHEEVFFI